MQGHNLTPTAISFAQESSFTRAPDSPKAPEIWSTVLREISMFRLFEGPLQTLRTPPLPAKRGDKALHRKAAVPDNQAKRYGDGLGETSCYFRHIPLAQ